MVSNSSNSSYLRGPSHVRNRNRLGISDCLCPRDLIANTHSFIRFPNGPVHLEAYLRKPGSSTVCLSSAHSLSGDSDAGHHIALSLVSAASIAGVLRFVQAIDQERSAEIGGSLLQLLRA